jgi:hypothetical protein
MTAELVARLAADFWERVGTPASWPRDLERPILLTTPVFVVRLRDLCLARAREWFTRRRAALPLEAPERPLNGCLVAYRGRVGIFLDARLRPREERVILAHEFGHYLSAYEWPRDRAVRRLGPSVLAVLDGERRPTPAEELAGALTRVPLGVHAHYMDRTFDPRRVAVIEGVERTANALACELLAPAQAVSAEVFQAGLPADSAAWGRLLVDRFGFPVSWAGAYAGHLLRQGGRRRFTDTLGL